MSSRISAFLDLNIAGFSAGVAQAGTLMERLKRTVKIGDLGGGVRSLLGGGALLQGFRATINAAQEARDRARELGRTVDAGTASVARYGDAWDNLKNAIATAATAGLGFFTQIGERAGTFFNDNIAARFRFGAGSAGRAEAERVRGISEQAGEGADFLSSPAAVAAARRIADERRREQAAARRMAEIQRTDAQQLAALQREQTRLARERAAAEGASRRPGAAGQQSRALAARLAADEKENALALVELQNKIEKDRQQAAENLSRQSRSLAQAELARQREAMSLEDQLVSLEAEGAALGRQAAAIKGDELQKLTLLTAREEVLTEAVRVREQIKTAAERTQEKITRLTEKEAEAAERVTEAAATLARQRDDARKFSPEDLVKTAGGRRDTTAAGLRAAQILRDEATARRLERSGGSETLFDARTQRNVRADSREFQRRALQAREEFSQLTSSERNPFAAAEAELKSAGSDLKAAAAALKTVEVTVDAS